MLVRLTPQSTFGTAQARCTAAAVPMLELGDLGRDIDLQAELLAQLARRERLAEAAELDELQRHALRAGAFDRLDVGERMDAFVHADRRLGGARERLQAGEIVGGQGLFDERETSASRVRSA